MSAEQTAAPPVPEAETSRACAGCLALFLRVGVPVLVLFAAFGTLGAISFFAPAGAPWMRKVIAASVVLVISVGAYALVYQRLWRQISPLIAIHRGLNDYATGIEREITLLELSVTHGALAEAWNGILRELDELRGMRGGGGDIDMVCEATTRFENQVLAGLLDAAPVGLARVNDEGVIQFANASATRMLAASRGELIGASLGEVIEGAPGEQLMRELAAGGRVRNVDWQRAAEGAPVIRVQVLAARDQSDPDRTVVLTDISPMREIERARDEFLYHVTHELRTPLTNIHAYAETLSQPGFEDETVRRDCYNVIMSETQRLCALVEDILSLSQLEVGSLRIESGAVDLAKLLRGITQDNLGRADEKQVKLSLKLPAKMPGIIGDKQRLAVLFNNMIGNAIKYTPSGGVVNVEVQSDERKVGVMVQDTGIGIAPDDQRRVFEKFYRTEAAALQQESGAGLGLAIAREIARKHGGDIRVVSTVGEGSTFTVELPVQPERKHSVVGAGGKQDG